MVKHICGECRKHGRVIWDDKTGLLQGFGLGSILLDFSSELPHLNKWLFVFSWCWLYLPLWSWNSLHQSNHEIVAFHKLRWSVSVNRLLECFWIIRDIVTTSSNLPVPTECQKQEAPSEHCYTCSPSSSRMFCLVATWTKHPAQRLWILLPGMQNCLQGGPMNPILLPPLHFTGSMHEILFNLGWSGSLWFERDLVHHRGFLSLACFSIIRNRLQLRLTQISVSVSFLWSSFEKCLSDHVKDRLPVSEADRGSVIYNSKPSSYLQSPACSKPCLWAHLGK